MAKQLLSASLTAPGFKGLNTEDPYTLDPEFAVKAENCVIDQRGRLVSRNGWQERSLNRVPLTGITRFEDIKGVSKLISWNNDGVTTQFYNSLDLTAITPYSSDPAYVVPAADWVGVTLNDHLYLYSKGNEPLVFSTDVSHAPADDPNVANGFTFATFSDHLSSHNTVNTAIPKAGIALAAYGRVWVADTDENSTVLYFSGLLDGADFGDGIVEGADLTGRVATNISTAGLFNVSALFTDGTDRITGLGAINGYLAIFCEDSIVLLGDNNPDNDSLTLNPATMTIIEVIKGVGCVAAQSVKNVGNDILFLSKSGVQSLGRTIQEKSQPLVSVSENVKTDLTNDLSAENLAKIRSVYSEDDTFYLLNLPVSGKTYVFDTRRYLDTGALRVTRWTGLGYADFVVSPVDGQIDKPKLFSTSSVGITEYVGFTDRGQGIPVVYHSPYLDFGLPNTFKYIKKLGTTFTGGNRQQLLLTAAADFEDVDVYPSAVFSINLGDVSLFNTPETTFDPTGNGARFGVGSGSARQLLSYGGSAELIQLRCAAQTTQGPVSVQRFDLYFKEGKQA